MKILIPVDGSNASINATKKAIEIARKDGSSLKMISVIKIDVLKDYKRNSKMWQLADGSLLDVNIVPINDNDVLKIIREKTYEIIDSILSTVDIRGIQFEKDVLVGDPHEVILETAKNENFDLIVMGNRGSSKLKRFFVGSVTQKVISEAPCPVLVINAEELL